MTSEELTFGEYIRRLRKRKTWNLQTLADESGLSYHHLSRVENDSVVPGIASVARLSQALDGDLKLMLEMAGCLPKQILERISARPTDVAALTRTAGSGDVRSQTAAQARGGGARALVRAAGVSESDTDAVTEAVEHLLRLDRRRQKLIVQLLRQFAEEDDGRS